MKYKIPEYTNTDSRCPVVSRHVLKPTGCTGVASADFSNADSLTVVGGFLHAQLADDTLGAVYTFCLKVEAGTLSITVPSL